MPRASDPSSIVQMSEEWHTKILGGPGPFPTTSWSLIARCGGIRKGLSDGALDELMSKYWRPVYFYIYRNWGRDVEKAKDLTQSFFATFIEKNYLGDVDAERGRFRSFVCASLRNFLLNEDRAASAKKRRPEQGLASLDALKETGDSIHIPAPECSDPLQQFDEDWKQAILDAVLLRLRQNARKAGREVLVDLLVEYDLERSKEEKATYEALASKYHMTVHQIRNGLHWIRKRFLKILCQEIEEQVASREDYDREVTSLFGAGS